MCTPILVSLSAPAFSYLLYENAKCTFQQEGFLLGEIIRKETKIITDNDQHQINVSKTIKINSVMPCPQNHYFYNATGKINKDKIKDFLGNQFSEVVAWYKYQKIPDSKLSFRDKIIHRQLLELFDTSPELFSCCLLTHEVSWNGATQSFSQSFVRCNGIGCDKLPVSIPNLSEQNNMYKSSEPASTTFNKILSDLKIDNKNTQGLVIINKIQNALQKHIETLVKDLSESEKYLYELEKEVRQLEMYKKEKEKITEYLFGDSINTNQRTTPVSNNNQQENKTNPIDTTSDENSPEIVRTPINKKTIRGRGKGKGKIDSKELRKNSKTEEYGVV
ncbi:BRISC complex subunit FAM175B-like [Diorhabda sublineata]|uniref:BRISC complex subunit FAM175B-like n=1 Tax=Diorhabda sublineata TaxID=1163346 RepID=UPI0024E05D99|nr:BRISC complex subunit FAM175B-like [Diorhabda sublineata]XP_056643972.1 BRISC complex subunit FAM175B-like [Diorhabda sublineata]